jgi:hypothetical protein
MLPSNIKVGTSMLMKTHYASLSDKFMVGLALSDLRGIYNELGSAVEDTG